MSGLIACLPAEIVRYAIPVGFSEADPSLLESLGARVALVDRDACEATEAWVQVCSYAVLRHWESVLVYGRGKAGGESQLVDRLSLGVGGHIEDSDLDHFPILGFGVAVRSAAGRELREELTVNSRIEHFDLAGFIRNEDDAVGRRHLGVVYYAWADGTDVAAKEPAVVDPKFVPIESFRDRFAPFERWSALVAESLLGG